MSDTAEQMERLTAWYAAHRNDDWEHGHGLKLDPLPEGGWLLIIDTGGTALHGHSSEPQRRERLATEWVDWRFEPTGFHAKGGPRSLAPMIELFFTELERLAKEL